MKSGKVSACIALLGNVDKFWHGYHTIIEKLRRSKMSVLKNYGDKILAAYGFLIGVSFVGSKVI